MKMGALAFGAILILALIGLAFGADINGKWKASFQGGESTIEQNQRFKVDGGKIAGTMSDPMIGEAKIAEGTLNGHDISFAVCGKSEQMGEVTFNFKGKLTSADEMTLTLSFGGGGRGAGDDPGGPPGGGMDVIAKRENR